MDIGSKCLDSSQRNLVSGGFYLIYRSFQKYNMATKYLRLFQVCDFFPPRSIILKITSGTILENTFWSRNSILDWLKKIKIEVIRYVNHFKSGYVSPGQCRSVGWALSGTSKGCLFDSQSGHIPRFWVRYPAGGSQWMFHSLPLTFSLNKNDKKNLDVFMCFVMEQLFDCLPSILFIFLHQ